METSHLTFQSEVWIYPAEIAAWHFVTIPAEISTRIHALPRPPKRGWGSLPVTVTIGQTTWQTSIFPDKRAGGYILPMKAEIRKREHIAAGDQVPITLRLT